MRPGLTISTAFHALLLAWGLIQFSSVKPREAQPVESLPIDLVSDVTKTKVGVKKAPEKMLEPVTKVDKVQPSDPIKQLIDAPVDKKDLKATPPPPKAQEQAEKTPEKQEEKKPDPAPSPDAKPQPKKEEVKKKEEPKKEEKKVAKTKPLDIKTKRKFDPDEIANLIDRRDPTRKQITGEKKTNATLGTKTGDSNQLSMDELIAFTRHLEKCWNLLPGVGNMERAVVQLRVQLKLDGSLSAQPQVLNRGVGPAFATTAETALRAVNACAPYKMLRPEKYNVWRDMIIDFVPPETTRG
ncbi:MAG: hypothetical protein KF794_12290 [Xanthobacteraceae bacterium]|nr:hypothetical protein [Xanthobacteraceae bacterium]QYK44541.1 MAG: hypothetical protein KF794_12290 [Xanthobacteraceae bacterium]